jgi:hypothetical protein
MLRYFVRGHLAQALSDRGAWAEAEKVAREGLLPPGKVTPDLVYLHYLMLLEITGTLCRQTRFAEAESLLQEHRRELAAKGCPPRVLLALQKESGKVLARSGQTSAALPILMSVATNALGTASACADAAFVALGSGDLDRYRQLCALGLARFAAGAEGINALGLTEMLLAAPQDAVVTQVASELVQRVEQARDFSREWAVGIHDWLEFRQGRLAGAAALWPKSATLPTPTSPIVARISKSDFRHSFIAFRSALPLAQLGRADEARRAYADGLKHHGPFPTPEKLRDLEEGYQRWYLAEAHRREAEQALKAKGIAVPSSTSAGSGGCPGNAARTAYPRYKSLRIQRLAPITGRVDCQRRSGTFCAQRRVLRLAAFTGATQASPRNGQTDVGGGVGPVWD